MARDLGVGSSVYGQQGIVVSNPGEVNTDIYGLETCSATYKCPMDRFDLIPGMFSPHPIFTYLNMERRRVNIGPDGFLTITGEYAGIPGESTVPIYEVVWGTSEEPIESHPLFDSAIGGTPSNPLNGAVFLDESGQLTTDDSRGIFSGFRSSSKYAGTTSFLELAQMTFRVTFMTVDRPANLTGVGKIGAPAGPAPSPPGGNWLYVGLTYQQRGLIFSVQQEWRGSGRNSWDTTVYG